MLGLPLPGMTAALCTSLRSGPTRLLSTRPSHTGLRSHLPPAHTPLSPPSPTRPSAPSRSSPLSGGYSRERAQGAAKPQPSLPTRHPLPGGSVVSSVPLRAGPSWEALGAGLSHDGEHVLCTRQTLTQQRPLDGLPPGQCPARSHQEARAAGRRTASAGRTPSNAAVPQRRTRKTSRHTWQQSVRWLLPSHVYRQGN